MKSETVKDTTAEKLKKYMAEHHEKSYVLVDVREPKEYGQAHIPGAVLIPLKEVETGIIDLADKEKDLIFYCRSGRRSKIAGNLVADLGIPARNIFNLKGGILSWQGKSLPGFPRINLFSADADAFSALARALELEKGTEQFYIACARYLEDRRLSAEARTLADFEVVHARVIYRCMKRLKPDIQGFDEIFEEASDNIMEGGIAVSEAVAKLMHMEGEPCTNFSEMALEIEFAAYDLYKNLAAGTKDAEIIRTMLMLCEQEKGHIRIIAHMLSECLRMED
ncbi:MAG: hypothetical protein DSZ23_01575 [Thermodesulfatator sp.]|nr:MAG: hypothetical protein DSZ23_01575 [Thermodesulfatator sp.]